MTTSYISQFVVDLIITSSNLKDLWKRILRVKLLISHFNNPIPFLQDWIHYTREKNESNGSLPLQIGLISIESLSLAHGSMNSKGSIT